MEMDWEALMVVTLGEARVWKPWLGLSGDSKESEDLSWTPGNIQEEIGSI